MMRLLEIPTQQLRSVTYTKNNPRNHQTIDTIDYLYSPPTSLVMDSLHVYGIYCMSWGFAHLAS
jgi:hypothetical protein